MLQPLQAVGRAVLHCVHLLRAHQA
jgi:hypothetical protein